MKVSMAIGGVLIAVLSFLVTNFILTNYFSSADHRFKEPAYDIESLPPLNPSETLSVSNGKIQPALLSGWYAPEPPKGVWSQGKVAYLGFVIRGPAVPKKLEITAAPWKQQKIEVWANGTKVGQSEVNNENHNVQIPLDGIALKDGAPLILMFYLPDAAEVGNGDSRVVALYLDSIQTEN